MDGAGTGESRAEEQDRVVVTVRPFHRVYFGLVFLDGGLRTQTRKKRSYMSTSVFGVRLWIGQRACRRRRSEAQDS